MGRRSSGYPRHKATLCPKKLIVAAGKCAVDALYPPPSELQLGWLCNRYNSLPESGGILDQPARTFKMMIAASAVYDAVQSWHKMFYGPGGQGTTKAWLKNNKRAWKIVQDWMELKDGIS